MASILYGVNGEGSGHSTRSKETIKHLLAEGHQVHVVSFDRGLQNLRADFDVTEVYGHRFAYVKNRVRYRKTVLKNLVTAPAAVKSLRKLTRLADDWRINLVCTDFEPLSYHYGRRRGLPVISIDNQHILTHAAIEYPRGYRSDALTARLVTRLMIPRATENLITAFFDASIKRRHASLVPPILRAEILNARPSQGPHVLVYVTSPSDELAAVLPRVRHPFFCYGFNREGSEGNLTFKKPSLQTFLQDLTSARAIIANSGFSLICEALHLGKPYLAVPVKHQFEQILNAYYVDKLGYGAYWDELSKERIEAFLFNLDHYSENLSRYPRQDNSALFTELDALIGRYA
ncbi:MAG TPA: glycosyltransferase family protein [Terriglobales bacterium]|jgi:uncharacterized protein (TIGR00661 family)